MAGRDDGAAQPGATRTGFGSDRHPFGPGDGLWLGGIEIAGAPRLHGHSDGDVALHAAAGALLGAAALGDLAICIRPTSARRAGRRARHSCETWSAGSARQVGVRRRWT